jgi:carboxylesterase
MTPPSPIDLAGGPHAALLIHGLASSPLEVRFVARLLHRAGFTVRVPVIPGYSMGYEVGEWWDWLLKAERVYAEMRSTFKTVCIAGLSVGATLALALASRHKDLTAQALWSASAVERDPRP